MFSNVFQPVWINQKVLINVKIRDTFDHNVEGNSPNIWIIKCIMSSSNADNSSTDWRPSKENHFDFLTYLANFVLYVMFCIHAWRVYPNPYVL